MSCFPQKSQQTFLCTVSSLSCRSVSATACLRCPLPWTGLNATAGIKLGGGGSGGALKQGNGDEVGRSSRTVDRLANIDVPRTSGGGGGGGTTRSGGGGITSEGGGGIMRGGGGGGGITGMLIVGKMERGGGGGNGGRYGAGRSALGAR